MIDVFKKMMDNRPLKKQKITETIHLNKQKNKTSTIKTNQTSLNNVRRIRPVYTILMQYFKNNKVIVNAIMDYETPWFVQINKSTILAKYDYYNLCKTRMLQNIEYNKIHKDQPSTKRFSRKNSMYFSEKYGGSRWPLWLQELVEYANKLVHDEGYTSQKFNAALINWYPDGKDFLRPHCDRLSMKECIVSFSFYPKNIAKYDLRNFRITSMQSKKQWDLFLEPGHILIMHPGMQHEYLHEIVKDSRIKQSRINITVRIHRGKSNY